MPIFEYQCPDCRAITEMILKTEERDNQLLRCPRCGTKMKLLPISKPAPFQWSSNDRRWNS